MTNLILSYEALIVFLATLAGISVPIALHFGLRIMHMRSIKDGVFNRGDKQ